MKYCTKCGAEMPDEAKFCPVCGFEMEAAPAQEWAEPAEEKVEEAPVYEAPVFETVSQVEAPAEAALSAVVSPAQAAAASSILKFGILGAAFSSIGILGIIFGAIARSKGKSYMAEYHMTKLSGKAKVGYILGKVGVICGILMAVYLMIIIIAAAASALS